MEIRSLFAQFGSPRGGYADRQGVALVVVLRFSWQASWRALKVKPAHQEELDSGLWSYSQNYGKVSFLGQFD